MKRAKVRQDEGECDERPGLSPQHWNEAKGKAKNTPVMPDECQHKEWRAWRKRSSTSCRASTLPSAGWEADFSIASIAFIK
jgi:hypothetical protein